MRPLHRHRRPWDGLVKLARIGNEGSGMIGFMMPRAWATGEARYALVSLDSVAYACAARRWGTVVPSGTCLFLGPLITGRRWWWSEGVRGCRTTRRTH